jgi:hypothetical protein
MLAELGGWCFPSFPYFKGCVFTDSQQRQEVDTQKRILNLEWFCDEGAFHYMFLFFVW